MMTLPLWPPKPKLFDITGPGVHGRASPMTTSIVISGSMVVVFAVGGISSWRIDSSEAAASSAPAAPRAWPVTPLVETTGTACGSEDLGHCSCFGGVVERSRRTVGVDLLDRRRIEAGVVEREPHACDRADTAG